MTECFQDEDQRVSHNTTKERQRRELTDFIDDDFTIALRQAYERLPIQRTDACFAWLIRRLWISHGDELPPDLKEKYLVLRGEISWLEDGTKLDGDLNASSLRELAKLVVAFHSRHRHLAGLNLIGTRS